MYHSALEYCWPTVYDNDKGVKVRQINVRDIVIILIRL